MTEGRNQGAASRGAQAGDRARELHELGERLRQGERLTEADVELARSRAGEAMEHDREAHTLAAEAHRHAAQRHRGAAEVAERAGQPDRAAEHRRLAAADDASADADEVRGRRPDDEGAS